MAYNTLELLYERKLIPTNSIRPNLISSLLQAERYNNMVECEALLPSVNKAEYDVLIAEGFFDRLKARGAQALGTAKGTAKGTVQQAKGAVQNVAGNAVNAVGNGMNRVGTAAGLMDNPGGNKIAQYGRNLQAKGQQNVQQGGQQGTESKYQSYIANSVSTIVNDLAKLGMEVKDPAQLSKDLNMALRRNLVGMNTRTGQMSHATPGGGTTFGGKVA